MMKRTFITGDEWLYYKIYTGPKTADTLLVEVIKPLTEYFLAHDIIDQWFFIRYADPDLHIRVRFHLTQLNKISDVIVALKEKLNPYLEDKRVWKVMTDTYQRELERYHNELIKPGESLFFHDSILIVNLLEMIEGDEGELIRWRFSLRNIDQLLDDFGYSPEQKLVLLEIKKSGFASEFNMNKTLKLQLDKKFRNERKEINKVLNRALDAENEIKPLFDLLAERSQQITSIVNHIKEKIQNQAELNDLLSSYIHMTMNRLFKSKQRLHEMVVYDFLFRYYTSELAKMKYAK